MCKCDKETIYFAKVKSDARIPSRKDEDGCYDVYPCFEEDEVRIKPGDIIKIPTGIASACSSKYRFALRERGSTGTIGMAYRAGQIDSGFRGEWFVPINNTSNTEIVIAKYVEEAYLDKGKTRDIQYYPYKKAMCQVALEEVPSVNVVEISYDELKTMESERGVGCLGSSKK